VKSARVALIFFALSTAVLAQAPGSDATALIQRASTAMGCGVVTNSTTISVSGSVTVASIPGLMHVTIQSQGSSRWRSDLDTPKEHKVTVVNDGRGQIQHADGRVTPLAAQNTSNQRPMHVPCLANISLPASAAQAIFLRTETIASVSMDVVELAPVSRPALKKLGDRFKTTVWISRSTGYVAKLQYLNAAEQDSNDVQTVEIDYFDYRVVDGLAVPFHQVTHDGEFTLDLVLDSVQLNTPAADFNLR
jgi:hypothetical protein